VEIAALAFPTSLIPGIAVLARHCAGWRTTKSVMKHFRTEVVTSELHTGSSQLKCFDSLFFKPKQVRRVVTVSWFAVYQLVKKLHCHGNFTPRKRSDDFYTGNDDTCLGQSFVPKRSN
jgi:hypothetical protein